MKLFLDIETRSRVDIKKSNVYRYTEDPDFSILMCAWAIDDEPTELAVGRDQIKAIPHLWDPRTTKIAHNAAFERVCFSRFLNFPTGKYLSPAEWDDSMALAGEHGYPQGLDDLALAVGAERKEGAGTALIKFFCVPNKQGEFNKPEDHPEKWLEFCLYCVQDVDTLRDAYNRLPGWPNAAERDAWVSDQRVNDAGIPVDVPMVKVAVMVAEENQGMQIDEMKELTGVANPNSNQQMMKWFAEVGYPLPNMQAATVTKALDDPAAPGAVKEALGIRQELALVASKKYTAALDRVSSDDRLRGSLQFFGAHTGRWSGRGVQLQNLPSATLKCDCSVCSDVGPQPGHVDKVIAEAVLDLKTGAGASAHTLKALVRAMFTGPFTVVDYAAIEARVVAWLAGEEWALQAFRDGRDIYVETAERMGGLTRKEGKVAVLALGYNGGTKSLQAMGAEGDERKLRFLVDQWRGTNPKIVESWWRMQNAFADGGPVGKFMRVEARGSDRLIWLPSGRAITYHDVKWERYVVIDPDTGKRIWKEGFRFADPKKKGARVGTYGGRLIENVTQAVARDVLSEAIVRLHRAGKEVVAHVHDEILVLGENPVNEITDIMIEEPTWAPGLPISAEGFIAPRYRKD